MDYLRRAKELGGSPPVGSPYSVALPASEKPGRSRVYRHWAFRDGLLQTLDPEITTVHEMFEASAKIHKRHKCLGYRPYDSTTKSFGPYMWLDYQTVQQRRAALGVGLVGLHEQAGIVDRKYGVGLWCQNRPEWQITDLACMSQSLYTVSMYDTLGPDATEYIINHASLACVVTSLSHIPTLLKLKPRLPTLKFIVSLDPLDAGEQPGLSKGDLLSALASDLGVIIHYVGNVESLGESLQRPSNPPRPDDIITINYTSGTTGNPKGAVLTHANAVAAASCSLITLNPGPTDSVCSYLPLAHIFGRLIEHGALWTGVHIGYFHGNILELVDDLKLLRPTLFTSVPRLYNRFGGAIRAGTVNQPGFKGALSKHVVRTKLAAVRKPHGTATNKHAFYDRVWGRKVASALGLESATAMVSGSAPLDPTLHQFLRVVFGVDILQGYGLTETYAISLCQAKGDLSVGNCGGIAPAVECCLLDVPDMDYLTTDTPCPRGELLIRGNTLFSQYYKAPEETAKAILEDGWFRTGDICSVDSLGRFTIIDRLKNVLKLAQGEYLSPERIENVYLSKLNALAQAYVHGDSVQTFLVAILGVQPDMFAPFASRILGKTVEPTDSAAITAACMDPRVRKAVVKELDKIGKRENFAGYERVRNCYLYLEPFSIDNGLLTPTLKLKRPQTARRFRADLDRLYEEALAEEVTSGKMKASL